MIFGVVSFVAAAVLVGIVLSNLKHDSEEGEEDAVSVHPLIPLK